MKRLSTPATRAVWIDGGTYYEIKDLAYKNDMTLGAVVKMLLEERGR